MLPDLASYLNTVPEMAALVFDAVMEDIEAVVALSNCLHRGEEVQPGSRAAWLRNDAVN
jgi:hypothetical protein